MTAAVAVDSDLIASFGAEVLVALGQWNTKDGLIDLLRARADALGITRLSLDRAAGLPTGYSGKILARKAGGQRMGLVTLETLLIALGMQMIAVENPAAMRRFTDKIERRVYRKPNADKSMPTSQSRKKSAFAAFRGNPEAARRLRAMQMIRRSEADRKAHAKHAAKIRWARYRARQAARSGLGPAS